MNQVQNETQNQALIEVLNGTQTQMRPPKRIPGKRLLLPVDALSLRKLRNSFGVQTVLNFLFILLILGWAFGGLTTGDATFRNRSADGIILEGLVVILFFWTPLYLFAFSQNVIPAAERFRKIYWYTLFFNFLQFLTFLLSIANAGEEAGSLAALSDFLWNSIFYVFVAEIFLLTIFIERICQFTRFRTGRGTAWFFIAAGLVLFVLARAYTFNLAAVLDTVEPNVLLGSGITFLVWLLLPGFAVWGLQAYLRKSEIAKEK